MNLKSKNLKILKRNENLFGIKVPNFLCFKIINIKKNRSLVLEKVKKKFKNKRIILRSSAVNEDNELSNAGLYDSYENLRFDQLDRVIDKMLFKLKKKNDEIIFQEFIQGVNLAGVIFTKSLNQDGPYININFSKSNRTNIITSGLKNKNIKNYLIYKNFNNLDYLVKVSGQKNFNKLVISLKKIEKKFKCNRLDIEFAIKNNTIYIFQCRKLFLKNNIKTNYNNNFIDQILINIQKKIKKIINVSYTPYGVDGILSNMADWNPAEMIGQKAKPLATSLYHEIITKDVWSISRAICGYNKIENYPLMYNLGFSPFIDVRASFLSLLPENISFKVKKKLLLNFLKKLKKNIQFHDKIEFSIVESCYYPGIEKEFFPLKKKEKSDFLKQLKKITLSIISKKKLKYEKQQSLIFLKRLNQIQRKSKHPLDNIYELVDIIKKYGTLPFANVARFAFVSTKILKELLKKEVINSIDYSAIYQSTHTISTKMLDDLRKCSKQNFIKKYGHLRPSTYSINVKNYKEDYDNYFINRKLNTKIKNIQNKNIIKNKTIKAIDKFFIKKKFNLKAKDFIDFAKKSISLREELKFEFSKGINEIFDNLLILGNEIKISRNDLNYIDLSSILNSKYYLDSNKFKKILKKQIIENKNKYKVFSKIELPNIITKTEDIYCYNQSISIGNYITNKEVVGDIVNLNVIKKKSNQKKIVLIENADPGYDYIFNYKIDGLITKFGGANSHMSIRCLEHDIPAIIGVGEEFENIKNMKKIYYNCDKKFFKKIL